MTVTLERLRHRYADLRATFRTSRPAWLQIAGERIARVCPPPRVMPADWLTCAIGRAPTRASGVLAALLRGEPVIILWRGVPAFVLFPYGLEAS